MMFYKRLKQAEHKPFSQSADIYALGKHRLAIKPSVIHMHIS